ncbi:MAG: methionine--tRNA ligase subunit beta [Nitrososphaerota archaeon]|nr:methionine--tRNA ligase subunit beta [Nitrososphaerota archaeon]MDG6939984.1 methionine--tRNA ligase subunit beta [Nitrososphaerota archaeon]
MTFPLEEFQKLDIRIGRIVDAKRLEGSKKLLELSIDMGDGVRRAVSGIAEFYDQEGLKGRQIAVVTNLPPRKIFGLESEVMILAAYGGDRLAYLAPEKEVPEGSRVS